MENNQQVRVYMPNKYNKEVAYYSKDQLEGMGFCPECKRAGYHWIPPMFGREGRWVCEEVENIEELPQMTGRRKKR